MEYEKNPNKKPYKSVLSNAWWSLRGMIHGTPLSLLVMVLEVPLAVFLAWGQVRLPALVVGEVTRGESLRHAALAVGLFLLAMLTATVLRDTCETVIDVLLQFYRSLRSCELDRKTMGFRYQTLERKETRDLGERAGRSTWMWNGVQPLSDVPRRSLKLAENLLCYALLGTVLSGVSPWLVVLLTLAPAVNILCARAYRKWQYAARPARTDLSRRLRYVCAEPADFAAWKDIRVYGMAGWFRALYRDLLDRDLAWTGKDGTREFLVKLADLLVILLRDGAAYAVLITEALRGQITAEQFVLYFAAVSSFADFVGGIVSEWNGMANASLFVSDFREYLDLAEDVPEGTRSTGDFLDRAPEIVFDHVSFRYNSAQHDTIHDISLTIAPGEKIALVGLNGAGKTTLVKLLCGLYVPTGGEIRVNGVPMGDFRLEEAYKLFAPVFQDTGTGPFTILETVTGRTDGGGDRARAEACLRRAGLGDKLDSLPRGMDTNLDKQLDKDGTDLSGGERQKLMLARALYKNAPVLVLDEPTAALDPIAENKIYLQYNAMTAGKTALFISHRLASTRFCDRILFLRDGEIAEIGTHEELIALGGAYSKLFEIQSCWYRDDYKGGGEE